MYIVHFWHDSKWIITLCDLVVYARVLPRSDCQLPGNTDEDQLKHESEDVPRTGGLHVQAGAAARGSETAVQQSVQFGCGTYTGSCVLVQI